MPAGKEAMTAETFDEDEYRDKLIGEGYSDESARTLAAKKKESFSATKIEIDLDSLAKAKKRVWVKPTATKKGHYREQEVGVGGEDKVLAFTRKYHYAPSVEQRKVLAMSQDEKNKKKVDFSKKHGHLPSVSELDSFLLFGKSENGEDNEEHLSPEERKKRQADRDKRQKERAAHRAVRRKQHDEVEEGIPEGK